VSSRPLPPHPKSMLGIILPSVYVKICVQSAMMTLRFLVGLFTSSSHLLTRISLLFVGHFYLLFYIIIIILCKTETDIMSHVAEQCLLLQSILAFASNVRWGMFFLPCRFVVSLQTIYLKMFISLFLSLCYARHFIYT
jgi:hypothetical protein